MSSKSKKKVYKKTIINNPKNVQKEISPKFSDILSIPSNPEEIFTLISPIGHGAFGSVYKAIHNTSKQLYAIKIVQYFKDEQNLISNINHMENINFCYKTVQEETSLMRLVNSSDYIVKYYGSYFSRQTNTLWLILEYCASGSVIDLMLAMDRTYTEIEIATIIKMVLQGLIVIHNKNLIHRDVKGANILLSEEGFAKIGDFGVGVKLNKDLDNFRKSKKGSPYWMSPQVVLNEGYSKGTDIWSLGITCLELINGEPPNSSLKPLEVMEKIGKKVINFEELFGEKKDLSEDFKNFIKRCLVIEEKERASAKELIKHNFIVKKAKTNKLLSDLYKKHINDLDEYRKEVEEYELELKMKQKKEREQQILAQQQKGFQNMSIKCDDTERNKEVVKNDDELFFNKSINSLFLNNTEPKDTDNIKNKNSDEEEYESSLLNNKSIKYIDNISGVQKSKVILRGNIFDDNSSVFNNTNERYPNTCSNNIYKRYENNPSTDIVNQSSSITQQRNLYNQSVDIKEYTIESNYSNDSINKNQSKQKNKIKCRIINFNKPINIRKKKDNNFNFNKTMDNKRDNSFDFNQKLILSTTDNLNLKLSKVKNNKIDKRKSFNLKNNNKSLSILYNSEKDTFQNKENINLNGVKNNNILEDEKEYKYVPMATEDNVNENKITMFNNFINKHKQLNKRENNKNMLNNITDNSNTYDNSHSNYNTNNISNNLSFINNNNSFIGSKKNYIILNSEENYNNAILEIPANSSKFSEINENINNTNSNMSNFIEQIEIKNLKCNKREKASSFCESSNHNAEDINDSDDEGIINMVNNFSSKDNFKDVDINNKENINKNINNVYINNKLNKSSITTHSVHSYSVVDSIEFCPNIHKNNIFSYAHKKYFS